MDVHVSRKTQVILIVFLAFVIVAGGTFAWISIAQKARNVFQMKVLPSVNLHDDFAEPDKDVYVENSGEVPIYLRVRLGEYMDIAKVPFFSYANREDADTWLPHTYTRQETSAGSGVYNTYPEDCGEAFHQYYTWLMGGQKFYMPATAEQRGNEAVEPTVVQNKTDYAALLKAYFAGKPKELDLINGFLGGTITAAEKVSLQEAIAAIDPANPDALYNIKMTDSAKVISMQQWMDSDPAAGIAAKKNGNFWVVDSDGWCYWANALEPGAATGLLLDTVTRTGKELSTDYYYSIDAWLQAVSINDADGGILQFGQANMSFTKEARLLLELATGDFIMGPDGVKKYFIYRVNGQTTNTMSLVSDSGGYGPIICAGDDNIPDTADDVKAGDTFSLTLPGDTNTTDLTVKEIVMGANKKIYLKLADAAGNIVYYGDPKAGGNNMLHAPGSPLGDDVIIWAGPDQIIGTSDDSTENKWVTGSDGNWYYNAGENVYYRVASRLSTTPLQMIFDAPAFICAGRDKTIGSGYNLVYNEYSKLYTMPDGTTTETYINGVLTESAIYSIVVGQNNKFYLRLATLKDGAFAAGELYIGSGADELLGTNDDVLYTLGEDGYIGTRDDKEAQISEVEVTTPYGYDEADIA